MPDQLPLFKIHLRKRGRACRWYLCTTEGRAVMLGSEGSRTAARYQANRALFLMLLASACQPPRLGRPGGSRSRRVVHQPVDVGARLRKLWFQSVNLRNPNLAAIVL